MPPFKTRIYFAGLCYFEPIDDRMLVLLVDDRDPCAPGPNRNRRHTAMIQFDPKQAMTTAADEVFRDRRGQARNLWVLDQEAIALTADTQIAPPKLRLAPMTEKRGDFPRSPEHAKAFDWVGEIWDRDGRKPKLSPAILDPERFADARQLVQGTVTLHGGELSTAALAFERGDYILWQLGARAPRAMASVVQFEAEVHADSFGLEARKFDGSGRRELRLRPADDGEDVELWIMNRSLRRAVRQLAIPALSPGVAASAQPAYQEYAAYYRLFDNPPPQPELFFYHRRAASAQKQVFSAPCQDRAMRDIFFPKSLGWEDRNTGAPCGPVKGGSDDPDYG